MMNKIKKLIAFVIVLLTVLCFGGFTASADSNTWYSESAASADNPVLLESNQYFQGVSINSHLISDLTFLEIPFKKYLNEEVDDLQVITFAEGIYVEDRVKKSEVVMYLYAPSKYYADLTLDVVTTKITFKDIETLVDEEYTKAIKEPFDINYNWSKISSYGNIIKYSFSVDSKSKSIKDYLLLDYRNSSEQTIVSSLFDCKITKVAFDSNNFIFYGMAYEDKWISRQEFNFIYEKSIDNPEEVALLSTTINTEQKHRTTAISYNEKTLKADGVLKRLRYNFDTAKSLNIFNVLLPGSYTQEAQYLDFFYYFFNLEDSVTGEKLTGNEQLTRIDYTYYEYLAEIEIEQQINTAGSFYTKSQIKASYYLPNGEICYEDVANYPAKDINSKGFDEIVYRETENLQKIYRNKSLTFETVEFKYPYEKNSMSVIDFITNDKYDWYKTNIPTIFRTNDQSLISDYNFALNKELMLSDFQFGMLVGEPGYPCTYSIVENQYFLTTIFKTYDFQYTANLVKINEIYYEYLGEVYHAVVSDTVVDDSEINKPLNPGNPDAPFFPGEKIPDPDDKLTWWERLVKWFEDTWNKIKAIPDNVANFFNENKGFIIGVVVVAVLIILGIFIKKMVDVYRIRKIVRNVERSTSISNEKKKKE